MKYSNSTMRQAHYDFAVSEVGKFKNPVSLTLTFIGRSALVRDVAEQKFVSLRHKLSKKLSRNQYKRNGWLVPCFAALEFDDGVRPHIHAIFDVPDNVWVLKFEHLIKKIVRSLFDVRTNDDRLRDHRRKKRYDKNRLVYKSKFNSAEWAVGYLTKFDTKDKNREFSSFLFY